jgi:hypothetical protein
MPGSRSPFNQYQIIWVTGWHDDPEAPLYAWGSFDALMSQWQDNPVSLNLALADIENDFARPVAAYDPSLQLACLALTTSNGALAADALARMAKFDPDYLDRDLPGHDMQAVVDRLLELAGSQRCDVCGWAVLDRKEATIEILGCSDAKRHVVACSSACLETAVEQAFEGADVTEKG